MARKNIDIGIVGNDGTGDSIREAFRKVNDNFKEMYAIFGQDGAIKFQDLDNVITEVRQIYPLSTATGLMKGIVIPVDGSTSFNINITESDSNTDQFTTVNTVSLKINDKITFSSNVLGGGGSIFGGVNSTTTYYINSIISNTKFTISLTQDGLGINRVITSDSTGLNIKPRIMQGAEGILVDSATDPERIIISNTGGRLISDGKPSLQSPLNANGKIIANVGMPTASNVQTFNNLFGNDNVSITVNDVVISKGYADKNYIRKTGGGGSGQIRARSEPLNRNEYTITIDEYINGNAIIPNHGFDSSIDGSAYIYNSTATVASGLKNEIFVTDAYFTNNRTFKITELGNTDFTNFGAQRNQLGEVFVSTGTGSGTGKVRPVYYIRYFDGNSISLYFTANDALNNANRIVLSNNDGTAVETLTDAYLTTSLLGNWASNEVLPRESVVRRQGDIMTGPLTLFDHPEPFEGIGTPNGFSDLQAATKYYVDNSSFVSRVNLFVSTSGQDIQPNTPPGKEGSSWAYSYASISKACQKAEYLLSIADVETGPYRQLIAYNNGASLSVVTEYIPGNIAIVKFSNKGSNQVDQGEPGNEDITPGKLLVGRLSGAKGIINRYLGLDNANPNQDIVELINVRGTFIQGENLEFGDTVKNMHVTIHVESGIYEEDYPIKLPANTAIVGDEFRRVLVRPKDRISQSPWVDTWFFRNTTFDNLNIVNPANPVAKKHFVDLDLKGWYSHHYYKKPGLPLNPGPKYSNPGQYTAAATLISQNKTTIAQDIVLYINGLLTNQTPAKPVLTAIEEAKSIRDTGFIIDAIVADLIEGGNEKIVNLQEVFSQVTTLDTECKQGIQYISTYINGSTWFATRPTAEKTLITNMINRLYFGFDPAYNTPKNNKDMDVFLCNDASIVRQITCQGHGGFMMVLDPAGQILTKSPYCQQSGSFSGSINKHSFRGGQYIDGFSGNLKPTIVSKTSDGFVITDIPREPEIPTSFYIEGERFKVNSWLPGLSAKLNAGRLMTLNKNFVKAQSKAHLDTYNIKFDDSEFELYINLIIDSLTFDVINVGNIKTTLAARRLFRLDELTLRAPANQKPLLIGVINYIRDTFKSVVAKTTVTTNQTQYQQIIDNSIIAEVLTSTAIDDLCYNLTNVVQNGIELADNLDYPEFILKVAPNPAFASINPTTITLITPGNTSMLSNDYTQVNDLGYGIVTNNKGLAECVSVFSYYCYTSMYSQNGGQIRSLNSSSANGVYGLVAEGRDPLEIPDDVYLSNNLIQVAKVNRSGLYINDGSTGDLQFYVDNFQYLPYNVSVVEIDHGGQIGLTRYIMSNITVVETTGNVPTVIRINLNTSSDEDGKATSLKADLVDNQNIIIRSGQNFKVYNVKETNPTRPSTALTFEGDPDLNNAPVYRVIAYNGVGPDGEELNPGGVGDKAILTTDTTYNYVVLEVDPVRISYPDPANPLRTLGSQAGDIKIAINPKSGVIELARINSGQMITAWDGKMHRVVGYANAVDNTVTYGIITLDELATPININTVPQVTGIQSPVTTTVTDGRIKLRAGLTANEKANVTVKISTLRATGHDFLDIGSGGYNDSNYPSKIFGSPKNLPSQANEVEERTTGRVFYVSTDQNGFFRVGRFFSVDQGTGTVKFAASIALSDLDGLGFKKGAEITEFSFDDRFTDLADDAVPTERAVDNYMSFRLGIYRNNTVVPLNARIGPGFLPLNGVAGPVANITWSGYKITNLGTPTNDNDATNKGYVDGLATSFDSLGKKVDVITDSATIGDVLVSFGNVRANVPVRGFSHATVTGDIETQLTSSATSTLATAIPSSGSINDIVLANGSSFPASGYVLVRTTNNEEVFYYSNKQSANILPNVIRLSEQTSINTKFNAGFPSAHAIGVEIISLNTLQLNNQIKTDTIINADIKSDAGILQSKLSMNEANTFPSVDWARTDKAQADLGLAKFDGTEFETDRGFVRLKDTGIGHSKLKTVAIRSVLGNSSSLLANSPSNVPFSTVFQKGFRDSLDFDNATPGKRYVWSSLYLSLEANSTQGLVEITPNATANTLVQRNGDGISQFNGIETDGGVPILSFSGTVPTATPVVYKGQWTPGTDASLHATSADYLTAVDTTVVRTNTNQVISGIKQFSGGIASTTNSYNFGDGITSGSIYFDPTTYSYGTYGLTRKGGGGNVVAFDETGIAIDNKFALPKPIDASDKFLRSDGQWAVVGTLSSGAILNTREITTGDAATTGTVTGDWTLTAGSKWQATYADLAEYYTADKNYEPGTVLVFGGAAETTTTTVFGDSRVAGVVTTDPAYIMNAGLKDKPNSTCLALQGRVPCKVVGKVSKGDLLTTSANPGYAIRATNPTVGTIIGKALENKDSFELGVIEIAVGRM